MKFYDKELKDKDIVEALKKCIEDYQDGAILDVKYTFEDIIKAIDEFEKTYNI